MGVRYGYVHTEFGREFSVGRRHSGAREVVVDDMECVSLARTQLRVPRVRLAAAVSLSGILLGTARFAWVHSVPAYESSPGLVGRCLFFTSSTVGQSGVYNGDAFPHWSTRRLYDSGC
jgi:hypothetical protein